jgi:peptidoglycan/xylan/chitin deacetylase (PgdA/CDA1 family)
MQQRLINLTFHGIGEPGRPLETGEADTWVSRQRFEAVLDAAAERADVRVTFDDGNKSDVEHALPALQQRGLTGTFFVVAGRLDSPGFIDADDVRTLAAAGMTIGCHGMTHRPWRTLSDEALADELVAARRMLEEVVRRPVTRAACPFGSYDRRVLRALRRSEYREVHTSDRGMARADDWLQVRNTVHAGDDAGLLERILAGEQRRPHTALLRRTRLAVKRWR